MRFSDGGLPVAERKAIAVHLAGCAACRLHLQSLKSASRAIWVELPETTVLDSILDGVLTGIRQAEAKLAQPGHTPADVKQRVREEVQPFLGGRATETILNSTSESGDNLLSSVEPVLALFLGSHAAARLVEHVVDRAIMRA